MKSCLSAQNCLLGIVPFFLLLTMLSCSSVEVVMEHETSTFGEATESTLSHYLWGVNSQTVEVFCENGPARLEVSHSSAQTFMMVLTLGLYHQSTYRVTCRRKI